eukprot:COSAG02_NODE_3189_length_7205_cov_21.754011_2_plen_180_part_00
MRFNIRPPRNGQHTAPLGRPALQNSVVYCPCCRRKPPEFADRRPSQVALRCPSGQASVTKKRGSNIKEFNENVVRDRAENCPCKNRVTLETATTTAMWGPPTVLLHHLSIRSVLLDGLPWRTAELACSHARNGGILGRDTDQVSYCPRSITLVKSSVMLLWSRTRPYTTYPSSIGSMSA